MKNMQIAFQITDIIHESKPAFQVAMFDESNFECIFTRKTG
jgi:hypothetical protein